MDESKRMPPFVSLLYDVYGNEYHCYLRSKINIPDKYLKHKPMKKYRVITYNLDWAGIPINSVIEELGDCMYAVYTGLSLPISIGNKEIHQALLIRGEWFEEIKEEAKGNFTLSDMVDFGRYVQSLTKAPTISIDAHVLNKWSQRVRTVSKVDDSPKEEPVKEFNVYNMKSFGLFCQANPSWRIERAFDYWVDIMNKA